MHKHESIDRVSAYPYKITLTVSENPEGWLQLVPKKNHIQLFSSTGKVFFVGKYLNGNDIKKEMKKIPMLVDLVADVHKILTAKPKKKKGMLYDLLVDILDCMGFCVPLVELNYELLHNHAHWIEEAKRYYHSAQILHRNYIEKINKANKLKRRSTKSVVEMTEAYDTDKVVIYLYSRALECILKSKVYYKFEVVSEYLTDKRKIRDKRLIKKWMEDQVYTHDIKKLSVLAGCCPRKKEEQHNYAQITSLLTEGKYPGPKKDTLYKDMANGQLEGKVRSIIDAQNNKRQRKPNIKKYLKDFEKNLRGERLFNHFNNILLNAVEKCYGKYFRDHFNEWHRAKILRRMTAFGINYNKEVRERNAMIRMAKKKYLQG